MTDGRKVALLAVVGALVLGAGDAGAVERKLRPTLHVQSFSPLVLRGLRFQALERVRLIVSAGGVTRRRTVRATRAGLFTASFLAVGSDRCNSDVWVSATGHRGSVASLRLGKLPQPQCPPGIP